jgi:hypothetical protein
VTSRAPLQFLILLVAGWIGRRQGEAIEDLRAENRVLRARPGPKRLRFADAERRLLALKGKPLGRKLLAEIASLATPETSFGGTASRSLRSTAGVVPAGVKAARNLTDAAGPLTGFGHLIVDRDPLYTAHFRTLLHAAGVQLSRLPSRSPNLNAHAERSFGPSSTSASGTLSPSANVICARCSETSWSTITPSATTRGRTFNDLARAARVDALVTRSISGHLTETMQQHYSTVNSDEQRQGIAKVIELTKARAKRQAEASDADGASGGAPGAASGAL